ncbi:MAG: two-component system chemotaxis family sensor kinase CheA [Limisphaerales bacterium]|nr:MAG: two-component system chemotaxis family sensor kinase CheA [Limisphaerales bacterium]
MDPKPPGKPDANAAKKLTSLVNNVALELAFITPGSDTGLLPINNFVMQMEELEPLSGIAPGVGAIRKLLDHIFDTTGKFDERLIAQLGDWATWMPQVLEACGHGQPVLALPASLREFTGEAGDAPSCPDPTTASASQTASPPTGDAEAGFTLNLEADAELLREFATESAEHLLNIEQGVLVLEDNPTDADTLNSIFRAFHSFKGCAGFLNLTVIKDLAHELESLLDAARQQHLTITSQLINLILEGGDILRQFVAEMNAQLAGQSAGQRIVIDTADLIVRVRTALTMHKEAAPAVQAGGPAKAEPPAVPPLPVAIATSGKPPAPTGPAPAGSGSSAKHAGTKAKVDAGPGTAGSVKVDTLKLDSLIDLVGELVIAESMVVQDTELRQAASGNLSRNLSQLRRITSELQRTAMSLRMVPIRTTFQKMQRLVRDLAAKQHKQLHLELSGEDTELDRNIVEELNDPLLHMIRNAADHGVEMPEARLARGKPAQGTIHLRAFHQGGNIVIQIQDDGQGLDKDRLLAKAREKGIVSAEAVLTEREIYELIFAAGFSTAEQITEISGRGVGMDVVRRNIEKLRGKVEIDTVPGAGTTFTIYLPLTLAIIDGLIVGVGSERYIIPTLSVRESFRPRPEMISTVYEQGEMIQTRGRLTPLLRLRRYFGEAQTGSECGVGVVVVVESGSQARCLLVDELIGKQEVVIKSLGVTLRENPALAGGAVLGDGRVGLILNVDTLVKLDRASHHAAALN